MLAGGLGAGPHPFVGLKIGGSERRAALEHVVVDGLVERAEAGDVDEGVDGVVEGEIGGVAVDVVVDDVDFVETIGEAVVDADAVVAVVSGSAADAEVDAAAGVDAAAALAADEFYSFRRER